MREAYLYKEGKNKYICFLVVHLELTETRSLCTKKILHWQSCIVVQIDEHYSSIYSYTASFSLQFSIMRPLLSGSTCSAANIKAWVSEVSHPLSMVHKHYVVTYDVFLQRLKVCIANALIFLNFTIRLQI